jgi:hypothetical protein
MLVSERETKWIIVAWFKQHTDDTADTRGNEINEGVLGVLGLHQDRGSLDDGIDGLETGSLHGFTGFYNSGQYSNPLPKN